MDESEKYISEALEGYSLIGIKIYNPLTIPKFVDLFSVAYGKVQTAPTDVSVYFITADPNLDYNTLIQAMNYGTMLDLRRITVRAENIADVNRNWQLVYSDAFGQQVQIPYSLNTMIWPMQIQPMAYMEFKNGQIILDGYTIFQNIRIPEKSYLSLVVYAKILDAKDYLATKRIELQDILNPLHRTEKEMIYTDYIQNYIF